VEPAGPIPVHREPIYTPRPDLVANYPTLPDARQFPRAQYRLHGAESSGRQSIVKQFPLILTSGRLVEYEGGGEETRSNKWLAELKQDMFVEINPADAAARGIKDGGWVWVTGPESNSKARMRHWSPSAWAKAWPGCRTTSPAGSRAWINAANTRRAPDPIVLGESVNTLTTHGFDPMTNMQEPKVHALPDQGGVREVWIMARMKFLCDAERCIDCNAWSPPARREMSAVGHQSAARRHHHDGKRASARSPWLHALHRRTCRLGVPVQCFLHHADSVVLHSKDLCIGCGYVSTPALRRAAI